MRLTPYDLPFDEDELAEHSITQASWQGETWQIGVSGTTFENGARATVCQMADGPLIWLTYAGNLEHISNSLQEIASIDSGNPFGVRMNFAYAFGHECWGRGFFLNDQFQLRRQGEHARSFLLVSPHGWAVHRKLVPSASTDPWDRVTQFLWSFTDEKNNLRRLSASQIIEQFEAQVNNLGSDFNFARTFASLSDEERANLLWPCKRHNLTDMKKVLTWAFLSQDDLWTSESDSTWIIDLERNRSRVFSDSLMKYVTNPPVLEQAHLKVCDFFQPQRDKEAQQKHLCLRFSLMENLCVPIHNPTAHERLEAALQWRDWLQTHSLDEK